MEVISLAEAKARLSEVLDRVEAGEQIIITRRGRPIARMQAVQETRVPIDFIGLEAIRAKLPKTKTSTVKLVRQLRDEGY